MGPPVGFADDSAGADKVEKDEVDGCRTVDQLGAAIGVVAGEIGLMDVVKELVLSVVGRVYEGGGANEGGVAIVLLLRRVDEPLVLAKDDAEGSVLPDLPVCVGVNPPMGV